MGYKYFFYICGLKLKNMKLIKASFGILSVAILITSCGGKDKKGEGKSEPETKTETKTETTAPAADATKLEGVWMVKRVDGVDGGNVGSTYTFKGNTLTTGMEGLNIPGTTEVTETTFTFLANGGSDKILYNYHFNGDTLVAAMQDSPQVFHLVKQ